MSILSLVAVLLMAGPADGAPSREARNIFPGAGEYCHVPYMGGTVLCWGPRAHKPRRNLWRSPERPSVLSMMARAETPYARLIVCEEVTCG